MQLISEEEWSVKRTADTENVQKGTAETRFNIKVVVHKREIRGQIIKIFKEPLRGKQLKKKNQQMK